MNEATRNTNGVRYAAFTLIELLVVVAIIAVLISILLPSLTAARRQARVVKCGANLKSVGQAFGTYLAENNAVYPPSYIYPYNDAGHYDLYNQPNTAENGYIHWSWFLFQKGAVKDEAFTCPEFMDGGLPRTNPGSDPADWVAGQQDDDGNTQDQASESSLEDRQAPRVAFTANHAVIPRNKFSRKDFPTFQRHNRLVNESQIRETRGLIVATEFSTNWKLCTPKGGFGNKNTIKSHRPVTPFLSAVHAAGTAVYMTPPSGHFRYGDWEQKNFGLRPLEDLENVYGVIDGNMDIEVNVVGRHHPGGDELGGSTNFLYADGSVARKTILQTLIQREWGTKFYSLTGNNTEVKYREP